MKILKKISVFGLACLLLTNNLMATVTFDSSKEYTQDDVYKTLGEVEDGSDAYEAIKVIHKYLQSQTYNGEPYDDYFDYSRFFSDTATGELNYDDFIRYIQKGYNLEQLEVTKQKYVKGYIEAKDTMREILGDEILGESDEEDEGNSEESSSSVSSTTGSVIQDSESMKIRYPSDYDYEEALKESYIASQLARPFESSMYTVLLDENLKSTLPSLYNSTTNLAYPLNYRDVYYKDANGVEQSARVADLFDVEADGKGKVFYIKYREKTGEDEDGNPIYEDFDQQVFYSNPYSYFYLTLAISDSVDRSNLFKKYRGTLVQMDQYGNIVLNTKGNGEELNGTADSGHHLMVLPNFANPALHTNNLFYLPSRLFLTKYDSAHINSIIQYSTENNSPDTLSSSELKKKVGKQLPAYGVTMYSSLSSRMARTGKVDYIDFAGFVKHLQNNKSSAPANFLTMPSAYQPGFNKYLNVLDGNYTNKEDASEYLIFVFGTNYKNYYFNNFQSNTYDYSFADEIATVKLLSDNSSFSLLPASNIFFGSSSLDFKSYTLAVKNTLDFVDSSWITYMHQAYTTGVNIFDNHVNWASSTTPEEISLYVQMLEDYWSGINTELFDKVGNYSVNIDTSTENPVTVTGEDSSNQSAQQANGIIDAAYYFINNVGTALVAIDTSKLSISYANLVKQLEENYLFHTQNVLKDKMLGMLIKEYLWAVIWINILWFVFRLFKLFNGNFDTVPSLLKKAVLTVVISTLPMIVLIYYCILTEAITNHTFRDTFVYWSLVDIDIANRQSDANRDFAVKQASFFRENKVTSYTNHGVVEIYSLEGQADDTSDEIRNMQRLLTGETSDLKPLTSQVSLTSLMSNIQRETSQGGSDETIMANQDRYTDSIFYYFYDTFRFHYYNYYKNNINSNTNHAFYSDRGLVNSTNTFVEMISDPYFLYGSTYNPDDLTSCQAQDICGLGNLFSGTDYGGRPSYYPTIEYSEWITVLRSNKQAVKILKKNHEYLDVTDNINYNGLLIYGSFDQTDSTKKYTKFENALQEVNNKCAIELQKLTDYRMYTDESLLFVGALICTMEFNQVMNKQFNPRVDLVPVSFQSESYSLDTIFRAMFLENSDQESVYRGDLMWAVEEKGGKPIQCLIIATAFIGQIAGLTNLVSIIILFLLACLVFLFAYNLLRQYFNKAWLGLLSLFVCMIAVHWSFIILVNWICIPDSSVIRTSLFQGYANGIRTFLLGFFLLLRIVAIVAILIFAFKHYKDLGGQIVLDGLSNVQAQITGTFKQLGGKAKTKTNSAMMWADHVIFHDKFATNNTSTEPAGISPTVNTPVLATSSSDIARTEANETVQGMSLATESNTTINADTATNITQGDSSTNTTDNLDISESVSMDRTPSQSAQVNMTTNNTDNNVNTQQGSNPDIIQTQHTHTNTTQQKHASTNQQDPDHTNIEQNSPANIFQSTTAYSKGASMPNTTMVSEPNKQSTSDNNNSKNQGPLSSAFSDMYSTLDQVLGKQPQKQSSPFKDAKKSDEK